jgi:uncharacterized Zn finger protein
MTLKEITEDDIYNLVGYTLAGRGYDYYEGGMVLNLKVRGNNITAEVAGRSSPSYTVKLWCDAEGIDGHCTCPYSEGVDVCKHVAAVLFEWVYNRADEATDAVVSEAELRQGLEDLSKEDLISLILEAAAENDSLYQKLRILTEEAETSSEKSWMQAMKAELQRICAMDASDSWGEIDIGDELETALEPLEKAEVTDQLEIYMYALDQLNQIDEAYETDEPVALLDRIYERVGSLLGNSDLSLEQKRKYLDSLIDIYFELDQSDSELGDVIMEACRSPEDFNYVIGRVQDYEDDFSSKERLLAKLYLQSGREEAYLEIRRQNLDSDHDYLELAEFYQSRGQMAEAIEIAEKGLDSLTYKAALYPFLEEQYETQGDVQNLQRILTRQFKEFPSLELYQRLKQVGESAGTWETGLKQNLLAPLEKGEHYRSDRLLAELYVADADYDKALALSRRNDIGGEALSHIAGGIAQTYPEEAIAIYKRLIDGYLSVNGRDRYRAAAQLAARVKDIYLDILRDKATWNAYIQRIRSDNHRRPALIDEFKGL